MAVAALFAGSVASAGTVFLPITTDYEDGLKLLVDMSMRLTHGPVSGEGDGMPRYEIGLFPPETMDLDLPELRGDSTLAAMRWANRWRELILEAFNADQRALDAHWTELDNPAAVSVFSLFEVGVDPLVRYDGTRNAAIEPISTSAIGRALTFAGKARAGGGGGGSGGSGAPTPPFQFPDDTQTPTPIVPPEAIPTDPGDPPAPPVSPTNPPVVESPAPGTPTGPGDGPGQPPVTTPPPLPPVDHIDDIDWTDPNLEPYPPLVDGGGLGDSNLPGAGVIIPTPTAVGLGAAGLLALGARMRRRGLV